MPVHVPVPARARRAGALLLLTGALVAVGSGQAQAASTTVGLWHLDETSGTTVRDSSGQGNTGTRSSGVTIDQAGASGRAYRFTTGHVTVPHDSSLNPGSAAITLRAQVKLLSSVPAPSEAKDFDIIRKGTSDSSGGYYKLEITDRALCGFRFGGTSYVVRSAAGVKRDDRFHAYSCRRTSSSISVTLDGVTTSRKVPAGSISNSGPVVIGARSTSGGDQTNAVVDEVSVAIG